MRGRRLIPALIFLATYAALAAGRVPYLRLRRTGAAVAGAVLMIASGSLTPSEAIRAIDGRTIVLLFVMMALVAPFRLTGALGRVVRAISARLAHPAMLLAALVVASGVLSAIFINDTICIVFTPVVLELAALRRHRPLPYLVALATASNIGSVATIVGNPQNILIGSVSRIGFWAFTRALAPVALAGFAIDIAVIWLLFRGELHATPEDRLRPSAPAASDPMSSERGQVVGLGPRHAPSAPAASDPMSSERGQVVGVGPHGKVINDGDRQLTVRTVAQAIDWNLLLLFVGLFIVVAGAERAGVDRRIFELLRPVGMQTLAGLCATAALLSNVVSNVPAVMLFASIVPHLPDPARAWLALAMASTLAGNLTILGSIANLIVVEGARRRGAHVSYAEYLKAGIPVTVLTMAFGVWWLR